LASDYPIQDDPTLTRYAAILWLVSWSAFADPARITPALPRLTNPTFAADAMNGNIPGWYVPSESAKLGYRFGPANEGACLGTRCALFQGTQKTRYSGAVVQTIDASAFRGKRIRLKAAVRVEAPDGKSAQGQLWLRVDRPDSHVGFYDDMADRPIISKDWGEYEIVGNVDPDAVAISFGLHLTGELKAWLDKVSLAAISDIKVANEPARPISVRGIDNLVAFAKLFGYVRYFHPSDEAASANWLDIALEGVRRIENSRTPKELAHQLNEFFRPLAPTVRVFLDGHPAPVPSALERPSDGSVKIVHWKHRGAPAPFTTDPIYISKRVEEKPEEISKGLPLPDKPLLLPIGAGISALVPMTLYVDQDGTLPHIKRKDSDISVINRIPPWSALDRATRLSAIVIAWNVFEHFYPYFDLVEADWPGELCRALRQAAVDKNERSFAETLGHLTVPLRDGHVIIQHPTDSGTFRPPISLGWVENQIVVTHLDDASLKIKPGDIVTTIEGSPAASVVSKAQSVISGAKTEWIRLRAIQKLMSGQENSEISLGLKRRTGESFSVSLKRTLDSRSISTEYRPPQMQEVAPKIFYIDIDRFSQSEFQSNLQQLALARGIIFDFRGYPGGEAKAPGIFGYLTSTVMQSPKWAVPAVMFPDRKGMSFDIEQWKIEPKQPKLTTTIAFLQDVRAISYLETLLGIVENYKLGTIVGENSAGTNGNVTFFSLPGGYRIRLTGLRVLKHDGSQHHGVGIRPNVEVHRTIAGVTDGRDEILERAIQVLQQ
jgi:C-terminal processing protease CtpA/Prc